MGSGMPDELTGKASPLARSNFELNVNKLRKEFKQAFFSVLRQSPPSLARSDLELNVDKLRKELTQDCFFHQQCPQQQLDAPWGVSSQRFPLDFQHQQRPQQQPDAPWGYRHSSSLVICNTSSAPISSQTRLGGVSSQRFSLDLQHQQRPQQQPDAPWGGIVTAVFR